MLQRNAPDPRRAPMGDGKLAPDAADNGGRRVPDIMLDLAS